MSTDPRKALEKEINKIKPDLVVMGNRGLGMVSRIMMGSVSNYILNHIEYPVMIIPDQ
ncbi:hypothetical protein BC833DRAFT_606087 [Globomyces pollinis-pini]|nr:hypothetical protein BC833DRAFT_606087 [Globomyces pollinis-pini]